MEKNADINASFTWTLDDLKTRQQALNSNRGTSYSSSSSFFWLVSLILILVLATNGEVLYYHRSKLPLIGVWLIFVFIVSLITLSIAQKRSLIENPDKNKHVDITITSDGIIIKTDSSPETRWSWTLICEVQKTNSGFCFFSNSTYWLLDSYSCIPIY